MSTLRAMKTKLVHTRIESLMSNNSLDIALGQDAKTQPIDILLV